MCEVEDAPNMWREIGDRETGKIRPNLLANRIKWNRIGRLQLSDHKDIVTPHRGSINSLQVGTPPTPPPSFHIHLSHCSLLVPFELKDVYACVRVSLEALSWCRESQCYFYFYFLFYFFTRNFRAVPVLSVLIMESG